MKNTKPQDTLFIDMKYIILYRKIGFIEKNADVFKKQYSDTTVVIEAENQRFLFNNQWHALLTYDHMVLLECLDRLLEMGYLSQAIEISDENSITLYKTNQPFLEIICKAWGYEHDDQAEMKMPPTMYYSSRLTGGLIEYYYVIEKDGSIYNRGFFEPGALYPTAFEIVDTTTISKRDGFWIQAGTLLRYDGTEHDVVIPPKVNKIGTGAFWNHSTIQNIHIPSTVHTIAGDAFIYCKQLKNVAIPESVERIGDNPFAGCPILTVHNESEHFALVDDVLFSKTMDTLIHYSPFKNDTHYVIPGDVTWVGKHSFYQCLNLENVTLSKNVRFLGNNPFSDCRHLTLTNLSPHFKYINGVLYNRELTDLFHFSLGSGVKDVNIENGVRTIGRNAFWNAHDIRHITIPSTVRQIGYNPFANCSKTTFTNHSPNYQLYNNVLYTADMRELKCCTDIVAKDSLLLHESTENIGRNAFVGCTSLETILLPERLRKISRNAFSGCTGLKEITVPDNVEEIGDLTFMDCIQLKTLFIPKSTSIAQNTFLNSPAKVVRR